MSTKKLVVRICSATLAFSALFALTSAFAAPAQGRLPRIPSQLTPPLPPNPLEPLQPPQPLQPLQPLQPPRYPQPLQPLQPLRPYTPPSRPFNPIERIQAELLQQLVDDAMENTTILPEKAEETFEEYINKLLDDFGPDARFGVTNHFVIVYDTTDAYAKWCVALIENVAATYELFISRQKPVWQDSFDPMVVFIFAKEEDFEEYRQKNMSEEYSDDAKKPIGFYSSAPNRSAFYDATGLEQGRVGMEDERTLEAIATEVLADPKGKTNISTLVHETTHQVSHNYGLLDSYGEERPLFSRRGENPSWAVEGLAMLFETPTGEPKDGGWKVVDEKNKTLNFPVNEMRLGEFQQFIAQNPGSQTLKKVVELEKIRTDEEGAYPFSWILFYYLFREEPRTLQEYLIANASMQPRLTFTQRERVNEFTHYFGSDWDGMYQELRAFADALEMELKGADYAESLNQMRVKYGLPEKPLRGKRRSGAQAKTTTVKTPNSDKTQRATEPTDAEKTDKQNADLDRWLQTWSKNGGQ
jgi:hypothetical protein